ncbi:hypothetical protein EV200_103244 [Pedobacter psychrotolerans]|uniref:Uncharacterized protein n=1 Tax=Pedobacter psychrotolerans TaxID=1843235 RepID=A0A4R2HEQ6_9SPHI|nr:hypothetical protein [Pedobacter psychrotolerans]TCO26912.1 hypothetical protein EV200_103244 [Pedobacter psychrotolerans]GGE57467.1 hypothetical protein GCM10011413_24850 [Pedobacter psychrotolerans]
MIQNILKLFFIVLILSACNSRSKKNDATLRDFSFAPVKGIRFEEVKRRFSNNLSFNKEGFMQEPSWIIEVAAEDTMMAWSPQKQKMQKFYLQYDHGNVYNFAEEFFKVKHISKDSLVFQRIQVDGRVIADDIRSDVNMTFYAQTYIKNKLKTTASALQKPSKADTLFIKKRSDEVNRTGTGAFAARVPVQFIPKSKIVKVEKFSTVDKLQKRTAAYDYMFPQYRIEIQRAYKDFAYECLAVVDYTGAMRIVNVNGVLPDAVEGKKRMMQGVADIYIRNLFNVIPGTTLGIPHNSEITVMIVGKAIKKP